MSTRGTVKCVMLGDDGVGKTCLLTSYQEKRFPDGYIPSTYGGHSETVFIGDTLYILAVFDTSCDPQYTHLRPLLYPQKDIFLLCFSVVSSSSFASVRDVYVAEANHFCAGVPAVVVGLQIDLRESTKRRGVSEVVSRTQGEEMAWAIGASAYVECSAKTGVGVQGVFVKAVVVAAESQTRSRDSDGDRQVEGGAGVEGARKRLFRRRTGRCIVL
ncbi:cell division control protein 42 [Favolaschia claudopus]|uniref:Cell division control protein 42 n=1 Tax=Favolaschia claudopus TaxID=2862362 RepID=A0AAW0B7J0_9AGAR